MTNPWNQAVEEIAEWMRLSRNYVVPFVGAGLSRAANLPTWAGLADAILESVQGFRLATDEEVSVHRNQSPLTALTFAREKLGDDAFQRQVTAALAVPRGFVPPEMARLCWRLNDQLAVTTNLDNVLELASPLVHGTNAQPLTPSDSLKSALIGPDRRVLHLHGTISRFDTWVMTDADYRRAVRPTSPVGGVLQTLLLDRVVLFLGYSCNDPDLNFFLDRVRDYFPTGSSNHYALMPDLEADDRRRLLSYGIHPIEYTPSSNSHPEVNEFLEQVLTRFNPLEAESYVDERSQRPTNTPLTPISELRQLSFFARRDRLEAEYTQLYAQSSNYALTGSSELPPLLKQRRAETIELLAGAWQVDTAPPLNAIDGREVLYEIGRGGFGVVWKVEDIRTHEHQALKVAHLQETTNYKFVERFKQGILAMRRLTLHGIKNTTKYIGHREVPLCVFMEYVDGGDLAGLIKNVPLELEARLRLAREIAEIVADAHGVPVYHRDLKPSNVLIRWAASGEPHAVLSDFDLAWFEGAISRTTTRIGDQAFASPEQLREVQGANQARAESDIYALGILLLFLTTKHIPSAGQWYNRNLRREAFDSAVRQFGWTVGAHRFADLIVRCATEDPEARPSAKEVAAELVLLHDAEHRGIAQLDFFMEEVRARVADTYGQSGHVTPGFHVEHRRDSGRQVIQASFLRQLRESDDRGRFKASAERAVKAVRRRLEEHHWTTQSQTTTSLEAKLVVKRELKSPTLESAINASLELGDALGNWNASPY